MQEVFEREGNDMTINNKQLEFGLDTFGDLAFDDQNPSTNQLQPIIKKYYCRRKVGR